MINTHHWHTVRQRCHCGPNKKGRRRRRRRRKTKKNKNAVPQTTRCVSGPGLWCFPLPDSDTFQSSSRVEILYSDESRSIRSCNNSLLLLLLLLLFLFVHRRVSHWRPFHPFIWRSKYGTSPYRPTQSSKLQVIYIYNPTVASSFYGYRKIRIPYIRRTDENSFKVLAQLGYLKAPRRITTSVNLRMSALISKKKNRVKSWLMIK